MKYETAILATVGIPVICSAMAIIGAREHTILHRLGAAVMKPQTKAIALDLLERVALGKRDDILPEWEVQVGLPAGTLAYKAFADTSNRCYALDQIGETGAPEAVEFLAQRTREDFEPDTTGSMWPAAQVALRVARLRGIADPQAQVQFIEQALASQLPDGRSRIALWAIDELCDRGVLTSMANIQHTLKSMWPGKHGEDELRFCETRIRVVNSNPDRVQALGSVLSTDASLADERLILWAIDQLQAMHSPKADREIKRFRTELGVLPQGSALYERWYGLKQDLDRRFQVN